MIESTYISVVNSIDRDKYTWIDQLIERGIQIIELDCAPIGKVHVVVDPNIPADEMQLRNTDGTIHRIINCGNKGE